MATRVGETRDWSDLVPSFSGSLSSYILRLLGLAVIDAFAIWLLYLLVRDGLWPLATIIAVITVMINAVFLWEDLYPIRWMAPGLALLILMVIYPILFTIYVAFTNYGEGHLLTKQQAVFRLSQVTFMDEDAVLYDWVAYRSPTGEYALLLQSEQGETLFARPDQPIQSVETVGDVGEVDEEGIPESIGNFMRLERRELGAAIRELGGVEFGEPPETVRLHPQRPTVAARFEQRYVYDEELDALIDQQTGTVYEASEESGYFVSEEGERLRPGYRTVVGLENFRRVFTSPALRGPFIRVFIWTFAFAILSVATTFALGLLLAILFNDPDLRGRKIIRSFLIIPYTIPAVISVLMWRGMLNPRFGPVNDLLASTFGVSPQWFADPVMAKVGVLLVNLWLGYPYMMLLSSGALQAIPSDVYEAASVDGANVWQKFRSITVPLLLVSLGPLLISSFAFNLNNFNVIFLYNEGGPPISGSPTPAGHTDILISYTYSLAFGSGRGADYGFAAAITIFIFLMVATITFFQFRYTKMLEEVSENV
ncbi:MAG: maltose ABC transporter permease MalF [Chloroflexota bacterium]|nr:maltose ABC transporter permease MalF [Chloroflexota bacterium]